MSHDERLSIVYVAHHPADAKLLRTGWTPVRVQPCGPQPVHHRGALRHLWTRRCPWRLTFARSVRVLGIRWRCLAHGLSSWHAPKSVEVRRRERRSSCALNASAACVLLLQVPSGWPARATSRRYELHVCPQAQEEDTPTRASVIPAPLRNRHLVGAYGHWDRRISPVDDERVIKLECGLLHACSCGAPSQCCHA